MKRAKACWACGKGRVCIHGEGIPKPAGIPALPRAFTIPGEAEKVVLPWAPRAWLPVGWSGGREDFSARLGIARGDASTWIAL
jgi:hypothetical protein